MPVQQAEHVVPITGGSGPENAANTVFASILQLANTGALCVPEHRSFSRSLAPRCADRPGGCCQLASYMCRRAARTQHLATELDTGHRHVLSCAVIQLLGQENMPGQEQRSDCGCACAYVS